MKITSAQIKYFKKCGFDSVSNENLKHIKVLPYFSVVQSVEGSYDISLGGGETHKTGEGGFFIAPSGVRQTIVHHVNEKSKRMSARWVFLDVEINSALPIDLVYRFPEVVSDGRRDMLNAIFDRIFESDSIWENYRDCYALLEQLTDMASRIENRVHDGVERAVVYMRENYVKRITVAELARVASMSESNFYAAFKRSMGASPLAYLNNYRLSLAADMLTESSESVSEISFSVGITDPLYFSRLFGKTYGMTPKKYRSVYNNNRK